MWQKLGFEIDPTGHHIRAVFEYDGQIIVHTRRSHSRRLDGQVPQFIRMQMKLNSGQFKDAIDCPLQYDDYVEILKERGAIQTNA